MNTKLLLVIALLTSSVISRSQTEKECRKLFTHVEHYFELKQYNKAVPYIKQIDDSPEKYYMHGDPDFNFICGTCLWFSDTAKIMAIPHFEKYLEKNEQLEEPEVVVWLANLYHMDFQYEKAKSHYLKYKDIIDNDENIDPAAKPRLRTEIDRKITSCEYGKMLSVYPSNCLIDNLGDSINSGFWDYAPVMNHDETEIYFTRKSPENKGKKVTRKGEYYEDVYHSNVLSGSLYKRDTVGFVGFVHITDPIVFDKAVNVGDPINTDSHDAAIQLAHNDQQLFIYKQNHVWVADIEGSRKFGTPHQITELNTVLNLGSYEPSVSINKEENILYFASERPGGYGGLDLYVSKKVDGVWQPAENLGPTINTEHDEDSPYIDPDNKTLYFSSKGHSSMGGYDIFKTILIDTTWAYPVNMGYPVNSNADDIFFAMPDKYNRAYFSSDRVGGFGNMDIYRISFADERSTFAEIRGKVKKGDELVNAQSKLTLIDKKTKAAVSEFYSDPYTGDYNILMDHDNSYDVKVETEGFRPYQRTFNIPEIEDYYSFYQEIHHIHLKDKNGNIYGHLVNVYNLPTENNPSAKISESEAYLYITRDSLMKLMQDDSTLFDNVSGKTKLYFLNLNSERMEDPELLDVSDLQMAALKKRQKNYLEGNITEVTSHPEKEIKMVFYFPFNRYDLKKWQNDSIYRVFNRLYTSKKLPVVKIEGHTDSKGTDEYNNSLSYKRAASAEKIIKKAHPHLKDLELSALGKTAPSAQETTSDGKDDIIGRQKNRRIVISFIED